MPPFQATAIRHYDVVIIGGGIAGLAVAELLARKSRLSIKVLDQASQLGTGASGKLEGWFHAGALYSGADDAQTFLNCLNGLEDLINYYSSYFAGRCNLVLEEKGPGLHVPSVRATDGAWFNGAPVYYIHPGNESPDVRLSRFKNDQIFLEIQRHRVLDRLEAAFGTRHSWLQEGHCKAPSYAQIEEHGSGPCSLKDTSGILSEYCRRFDESFGLPVSSYDVIKSLDFTVNTASVMRSLCASALQQGVDLEPGLAIDSLVMERFGPLRIKSLMCRSHEGRPLHLKAKLYIFAVGAGFEPYLPDLNLRARLKMSRSAMIVASPALCEVNFVRMSTKDKFHFNHLVQQGTAGGRQRRYSMLANSGYSGQEADLEQNVSDADALLESAERFFGTELYGRKLYSYDCVKTEFISEEQEKRRYSYWIELNRDSNFISILPGKFSFFPTVAYQAYLKIKEILDLKEISEPIHFSSDATAEQKAEALVADHYPLQILAADPD